MFLAVLLVGVFTLFIVALTKWWHMKYHYFDTGVGVKYTGIKLVPLLGNALYFLFSNSHEYLDATVNYCLEHNGKMMFSFGYICAVAVTDYKLTEFIMRSNTITKKADPYRFLTNWLGTGLLNSHGEKWRKRRKMLTPAFHYQILESFVEVFHSATDTLIEVLNNEMDNKITKVVDIQTAISNCALDIICETAMGIKINAQTKHGLQYVKYVGEISKIFLERLITPHKFYDLFYQYTSTYRKEIKYVEYLHNHTYSIIRSRRKELEENGKFRGSSNDETDAKNKKAFLDILLQSTIDDQPLSDEDIREEVDTFMFEGHDTTSAAICFALFSIAENPDVQTKILQEQKLIFGNDRSRFPNSKDLNSMKYLEMVIKETLRLYPSVPAFAREVTEDFEYDGVIFKKGLQLAMFIYGSHRNPEYFPEPEKFIPERFAQENLLESKPFAHIPFSAGPRNCIGQKFAMLEMKSTLSKVIRYFELSAVVPKHKLQLVPETILRCKNGFPIQFTRRIF